MEKIRDPEPEGHPSHAEVARLREFRLEASREFRRLHPPACPAWTPDELAAHLDHLRIESRRKDPAFRHDLAAAHRGVLVLTFDPESPTGHRLLRIRPPDASPVRSADGDPWRALDPGESPRPEEIRRWRERRDREEDWAWAEVLGRTWRAYVNKGRLAALIGHVRRERGVGEAEAVRVLAPDHVLSAYWSVAAALPCPCTDPRSWWRRFRSMSPDALDEEVRGGRTQARRRARQNSWEGLTEGEDSPADPETAIPALLEHLSDRTDAGAVLAHLAGMLDPEDRPVLAAALEVAHGPGHLSLSAVLRLLREQGGGGWTDYRVRRAWRRICEAAGADAT